MESPRVRLTDKKRKWIKNMLSKFDAQTLKQAITGCSMSDFHMGRSEKGCAQHNSLELILRSVEKVEQFLAIYDKAIAEQKKKEARQKAFEDARAEAERRTQMQAWEDQKIREQKMRERTKRASPSVVNDALRKISAATGFKFKPIPEEDK